MDLMDHLNLLQGQPYIQCIAVVYLEGYQSMNDHVWGLLIQEGEQQRAVEKPLVTSVTCCLWAPNCAIILSDIELKTGNHQLKETLKPKVLHLAVIELYLLLSHAEPTQARQ